MNSWSEFVAGQLGDGVPRAQQGDHPLIARYDGVEKEYASLSEGPAVVDRSYRGLLEVSGKDRASWLHNLTTNQVKLLRSGEGNYAFVLNIKGRILFDVNVLVRAKSIWVDVDRRFLELAARHFAKYTIMEEVTVTARDDFVRLGLVGRRAATLLAELGLAGADGLPALGLTELSWSGSTIAVVRHDFCGPFAVELYVPENIAVDMWRSLTETSRHLPAIPAGDLAVQIRRIEAGIPWPGHEITEEYLPAETGQLPRAVSFNKGCYLGQEVVERMNARHVVARRLVGLRVEGTTVPPMGSMVVDADQKPVGQVTSAGYSPGIGAVLALGYVKTSAADVATRLSVRWESHSERSLVILSAAKNDAQ